MNVKPASFVLTCAFILFAHNSNAEEMESISRPSVAAAECPTEWNAITLLDPDLWIDTNPIGIDPSLDQATTNSVNKYFLSIMAITEHFGSLRRLEDPDWHTQNDFDIARECRALFPTFRCISPIVE